MEKVERHYSIIAIISFILGCLGVLLERYMSRSSWMFALFIPILAIIFGFIGLDQVKKDKLMIGSLFAVLGLVLGFFEIFSLLITKGLTEFENFLTSLWLVVI